MISLFGFGVLQVTWCKSAPMLTDNKQFIMSTHRDSLAAFFGRSPLSSVPPGYNRFIMIEMIKVENHSEMEYCVFFFQFLRNL